MPATVEIKSRAQARRTIRQPAAGAWNAKGGTPLNGRRPPLRRSSRTGPQLLLAIEDFSALSASFFSPSFGGSSVAVGSGIFSRAASSTCSMRATKKN